MKFNLLLTNQRRVQWLLGALLTYAAGCLGLLGLHVTPSFWALAAPLLALLVLLPLWDKLMRQPAWVLVAADGVAWANPADSPPVRYAFADVRAYRFEWSKLSLTLQLYLQTGERVSISGRLHEECWTMEQAFEQAVKHYNLANSGTEVAQEPTALTTFFTSPAATRVLLGLLAATAAWVGWGLCHGAPAATYLPLPLLLPYLLVWANFYYERP